MGVRPPTNDTSEPDVIEFGIAAVDARLDERELSFPADRETVRAAFSGAAIPYNASGSTVAFETVLDAVDVETFEDEQELLNALHPVFEEYRASRTPSLLQRLRSLFPF
ncbi:MAG TPA: hypothetical protein VJ898_15285 [Natrialbaceae archaeon]|nr:hypothetical protein [Natrialbaceae archaeon]